MTQFKRFFKIKSWVMMICAFAALLTGCTDAMQQNLRPKPVAYGEINTILVVMDEEMWKGPVGDTLNDYYSSAFIILPQPEPIFDLWHFTPEEYMAQPVRREGSDYLIVANLADATSPATKLVLDAIGEENARRAKEDPNYNTAITREKYAEGQMIIYQFAYSQDALMANIAKNFPAIAKKFRDADKPRFEASIYLDGENRKVADAVQEKLGISMRVPKDYLLASSRDDVLWLRKETGKLSSNIMLKKLPYTAQSQLTKEGLKAVQDSIGRKYVSSQIANTYMRINDIDLPMFVDAKTIDNKYALEARGIWEMENDYMGGPFISYLIHNPEKNELVLALGFVYAPGEDKRNWMQYLEYVLNTVKF
ncbi:MAG: DUF4837 family protein [Saprospiraceae bacterium]